MLRLRENETMATAELSQAQARQLRQQFGDHLDVQRDWEAGGFLLTAKQTIGIIAMPGVRVHIEPKVPLVKNGTMELRVRAVREKDFKAPIAIRMLYNPPGTSSSGSSQIPEGKDEGTIQLTAGGNAETKDFKVVVLATATVGAGPVEVASQFATLKIGQYGTAMKSTTWPCNPPGNRKTRSVRLPSAPPIIPPIASAHQTERRLRARNMSTPTITSASRLTKSVAPAPSENAAPELRTKTSRNQVPSNSTGGWYSKRATAHILAS